MSAFDRRRVSGPENSFGPIFERPAAEPAAAPVRAARGAADIRPLYLKTGLTSQANGSAYIETEKTKVACAVYGPRQPKNTTYSDRGKLNVEFKFAPFSAPKRRVPNKDSEVRSYAMRVHQALLPSVRLELLPKSSVDVFITVLESDGLESCVAASVVAASTALANASIETLGIVASCTALIWHDGQILLDPNEEEIRRARAQLSISYMPALHSLTSIYHTGVLQPQDFEQCIQLCENRCSDIHAVVVHTLREDLQT